jgi:hypothetical protein
MGKGNKRNRRPTRPERTAGPRRCPDFNLVAPREYRRDLLLERNGDDERTVQLKGFTIALALAFNDIKDVMWVNLQLHKCEPEEPPRIDTYRGQWVGMNGAFNRYAAGFMTEMGNCLKAAKEMGLLETPAFRAAEQRAAERAPFAVPAWRQLVIAFTTGDKQPDTRVARFLEHIRHNSFHYGHEHKFKELRRGYRDCFTGQVESHGGNQSALASLGRNIWATRFYFADAAIAAFTKAKLSDYGIKGPDLEKFSKNLGTALRYILEALLEHFEAEPATGSTILVSAGAGS